MLKPKKEKGVLANLPGSLELYKMHFRLEGYTLEPAQHPWAGRASYTDLAQKTALPEKSHIVRMEFATPTAFRSEGVDIPLPVPGHVFRGCWQKWNAFAPKEPEDFRISAIWPEFANACIVVSELRGVNTEQWSFAEGTRGAATGFTGIVEFTLLPKKKCGDFAPYWEGSNRVLQHLAQFAFYCGIGHHATIGLGQVRLVPLPRSL